jgi:hypothetical protein
MKWDYFVDGSSQDQQGLSFPTERVIGFLSRADLASATLRDLVDISDTQGLFNIHCYESP